MRMTDSNFAASGARIICVVQILLWLGPAAIGQTNAPSTNPLPVGTSNGQSPGNKRRSDPYSLIGEARRLISLRQISLAENLLTAVIQTNHDGRVLIEAYRVQATAALARKELPAVKEAYFRVFDLVLKPHQRNGDPSRIAGQVIMLLNECDAVMAAHSQPALRKAFREQVTAAVEATRKADNRALTGADKLLLNEHLQQARDAKRAGRTSEAVAKYEYVISQFPAWFDDPVAFNTLFAWIEAHGYGRNSAERIQMLERLYNDPKWQDNPRIANVGVHLGTAYEVTRNPNAFAHWERIVLQIEGFRADATTPDDVQKMLVSNYEFSLVSFADMLKSRGNLAEAERVTMKIRGSIPNGEGTKFADRTLRDIKNLEKRKGVKYAGVLIVATGIGPGLWLWIYVKPRIASSATIAPSREL